jgi:hypothetical protein
MKIVASGSGLRVALLLVTIAGALALTLAPEEGAAEVLMLSIGVALFVAEIGLGIADHFRSARGVRS